MIQFVQENAKWSRNKEKSGKSYKSLTRFAACTMPYQTAKPSTPRRHFSTASSKLPRVCHNIPSPFPPRAPVGSAPGLRTSHRRRAPRRTSKSSQLSVFINTNPSPKNGILPYEMFEITTAIFLQSVYAFTVIPKYVHKESPPYSGWRWSPWGWHSRPVCNIRQQKLTEKSPNDLQILKLQKKWLSDIFPRIPTCPQLLLLIYIYI